MQITQVCLLSFGATSHKDILVKFWRLLPVSLRFRPSVIRWEETSWKTRKKVKTMHRRKIEISQFLKNAIPTPSDSYRLKVVGINSDSFPYFLQKSTNWGSIWVFLVGSFWLWRVGEVRFCERVANSKESTLEKRSRFWCCTPERVSSKGLRLW